LVSLFRFQEFDEARRKPSGESQARGHVTSRR
jgi:hypothetical protein